MTKQSEAASSTQPLDNLTPIAEMWAEYHNTTAEDAPVGVCAFAMYVHKRLAGTTTTPAPCGVQDHADKAQVVGGGAAFRTVERPLCVATDDRGGCDGDFRGRPVLWNDHCV